MVGRVLLYVVLASLAATALTPLAWLLAAAVKSNADFHEYSFFAPPHRTTAGNFVSLFGQMDFLRLMMNSFFVTCATVILQLLFSSLGGFALAKYRFRGRRAVIFLMLSTMMIPGAVLLAPMYELIFHLGLIDTHAGLIVPGLVSVFGMFLFRQAMLAVPDDLLEAARIDGAGEFRCYWEVALPLVRPMVGAFCLIAFMASWNSFLWPQIILQSQHKFTLPIGLNQLVGIYKEDYGALMAGTLLAVLPVVVLFFLLQREFIAGLTKGAVKG